MASAVPATAAAGSVALANLVQLCKELCLPVSYKVFEQLPADGGGGGGRESGSGDADPGNPLSCCERSGNGGGGERTFFIVVHVLSDHAFKKYMRHCSRSDAPLLRGMLLKVVTDASVTRALSAGVQQAFLPKFENEGQDEAIADQVTAGAAERYMVVTIKHSGSLVTLSAGQGFAAKNSRDNHYTAGAAALLRAHYERSCGCSGDGAGGDAALAALRRLMVSLEERGMAVSFEMVTGCHGHHGQVPAGEYLVATSAHTVDAAGRPSFLPWHEFLDFCIQQGLPLNDTWLFTGSDYAAAARDTLDALALAGGPTSRTLQGLGRLVQAGAARGCVHLPGSYPHDQWQGSRIEGFVVSLGQLATPPEEASLRALAPAMARAALPLAGVGVRLVAPYAKMLAAAGGDVEAVKAQVKAANADWLPQPRMEAAPQALRDAVVAALAASGALLAPAAGAAGDEAAGPLGVECPGGGGGEGPPLVYSRGALSRCDAPRLRATLVSAAEGAARAADEAQGSADAGLLRQLIGQLKGQPDEAVVVEARSKAARALSGGPDVISSLRYKKKMVLWTPPSAQATPVPPAAPGPPADGAAGNGAGASSGGGGGGGGGGASSNGGGAGDGDGGGVVGYCMMTFVIRNGLKALALGLPTYLAYVDSLARSWRLTRHQAAQVNMFARAWADWISRRGGAAAVRDASYLDAAEPFARAFLASGCCMGAGVQERPPGAFQGLLILVDTDESLVGALKSALHLQHVLDPGGLPPYSKQLVAQGSILCLPRDTPQQSAVPRGLIPLLQAAARHTFAVVQRPPPPISKDPSNGPAAKRQFGIHKSKVKPIEKAIEAAVGAAAMQRRVLQLDAPANAAGVAAWAGGGAPLPEPDAACVVCFVGIPGCGKSALAQALGGTLPGAKGPSSLEVLNSDRLRQKGLPSNRYWHQVAAAADSCVGGGHMAVVVADKNLVPYPQDNVGRAAATLRECGAATLAVVPTCAGAPPASRPDVHCGLPELPFPLELVALCALRAVLRSSHEGGVDAQSPACMTVVVRFAHYYRHITREDLLGQLRSHFSAVVELPVMQLGPGEDQQVPVEVLQHLAHGLASLNQQENPPLPPEWEERARQLLTSEPARTRVLALQRPLEDCAGDLAAAVRGVLLQQADRGGGGAGGACLRTEASLRSALAHLSTAGSQAGTAVAAVVAGSRPMDVDGGSAAAEGGGDVAAASDPARGVRYIAIAGFDPAPLLAASQQVLPPEALAGQQAKAGLQLHVTLWHAEDPVVGPQRGLRDALLAAVGSEAVFEAVSIDCSAGVTAAQVRLLSGPEGPDTKAYLHVTLAVAPGSRPKDAASLPRLVAEGSALRVALAEPLQMVGQVLAFS